MLFPHFPSTLSPSPSVSGCSRAHLCCQAVFQGVLNVSGIHTFCFQLFSFCPVFHVAKHLIHSGHRGSRALLFLTIPAETKCCMRAKGTGWGVLQVVIPSSSPVLLQTPHRRGKPRCKYVFYRIPHWFRLEGT